MTASASAFVGLMIGVLIVVASVLGWEVLVGFAIAALALTGVLYLEGHAVRLRRARREAMRARRLELLEVLEPTTETPNSTRR